MELKIEKEVFFLIASTEELCFVLIKNNKNELKEVMLSISEINDMSIIFQSEQNICQGINNYLKGI